MIRTTAIAVFPHQVEQSLDAVGQSELIRAGNDNAGLVELDPELVWSAAFSPVSSAQIKRLRPLPTGIDRDGPLEPVLKQRLQAIGGVGPPSDGWTTIAAVSGVPSSTAPPSGVYSFGFGTMGQPSMDNAREQQTDDRKEWHTHGEPEYRSD